jgi:hypothetical protein
VTSNPEIKEVPGEFVGRINHASIADGQTQDINEYQQTPRTDTKTKTWDRRLPKRASQEEQRRPFLLPWKEKDLADKMKDLKVDSQETKSENKGECKDRGPVNEDLEK